MPDCLAGRVVVVTGAAGGIGRALCARFARAGAKIALLDRDEEGLREACATLERAGHDAVALPCDVTDYDRCRDVMEDIAARLGGIDVLINNAGAVHRSGLVETDVAVLRRVMEVNYFGSLHCAKAALPSLIARHGRIVVISSIAGVAPLFGRTGYAASKHALHGLFESARTELASSGVSVLMVCPSFTRSGFEQAALGANGEPANRPRSRVGSLASPESVADAVFAATIARRRLLVLSPIGKLSYLLSRLAPSLYDRMMVRRLGSELQG